MTTRLDSLKVALAAELDRMKAAGLVPPPYEANILLRNSLSPCAHILIGQSDPRKVADAVSELIDNPESRVGIASSQGVRIEL